MKALLRSFKYAFNGILLSVGQRNMRIHLCFAFYIILGGVFAGIDRQEWRSVLLCIALVIGAECLNTAIETLCDTLHPERSPGIGRTKDLAAGAVLVCAIFAAITGVMIFINAEKINRSLSFAKENPIFAAMVILCLPVWIYYIFRSNTNDK